MGISQCLESGHPASCHGTGIVVMTAAAVSCVVTVVLALS